MLLFYLINNWLKILFEKKKTRKFENFQDERSEIYIRFIKK